MSDLIDRQDAIEAVCSVVIGMSDYPLTYAYEIAEEALEKLPSAQPVTHEERTETHACDLISRQAAIDSTYAETVSTNPEHFKSSEKFIGFMDDVDISEFGRWQWANGFNTALVATKIQLEKLPSAQPEQQWIPCSERLPEEKDAGILKKLGTEKRSEYVLATVEVKGERMTVAACTYDGKWEWKMKYAFPDFKIVAWMPLPTPYQPKEDES